MENKQTAVEWLECELKKIPFVDPKTVFNQAKVMEKEQMEISDEEIINASYNAATFAPSFIRGAQWYREQIKNKTI